MGLFNTNYATPGKGISKEEAAKRSYFDILGRKFWKMMELNLVYFACNVIFFGAALLFAIPYLYGENAILYIDAVINSKALPPILPFVPFMLTGPFTAGLTYIVRNYSRQEHAFLCSDFFEHTKKNWKQGLLMSILQCVMIYLFITAFFWYRNFFIANGINIGILFGLTILLGAILFSASFYLYPLMITFEMRFTEIIKNSFILAIAKLPQNTLILIVIGAVHILLLYNYPLLWLLLMALFLIVWSSYTMNYYVWNVMDKHLMPKAEEEKDETLFEDATTK